MGITRVRIEAEGRNHEEVLEDLNQGFGLFYSSRWIPRESEFVEEVVESHIRNDGAIQYRGRRVIKFADDDFGQEAKIVGDPQAPLSWIVSGSATSAFSSDTATVWNAANAAAVSASIPVTGTWELRDANGAFMTPHHTVAQATNTFVQPFYFHPSAGVGG